MNNYISVRTMAGWPIFHEENIASDHVALGAGFGDFSAHMEQPSLLIFSGTGHEGPAREDIDAMAAELGLRLLDHAAIAVAGERLSQLVDVDATLVRCTGSEAGLDLLLARLDTMASGHGMGLVVIVDFEGLDHVHSIIGADDAIILCQPQPADVVAALATVFDRSHGRQWLNDIGRESSDARIDKLSSELVRLSRTIEALVQNRVPSQFAPARADREDSIVHSPGRSFAAWQGDEPVRGHEGLTPMQVRAVLRGRRLREQLFPPDLFADPAWDILLDLMAARLEGNRVSVSSLCIAAAVPPTTALRWIRQLTEGGLLIRQADPNDGRRIFIALSEKGVETVVRWFEESRSHFQAALGQTGDGKDGLKASA